MFTRSLNIENNYLRVLTYINIKLIKLCFLLRKDIFNHRNINLILFLNHNIMCFIIQAIVKNSKKEKEFINKLRIG